MKKSLTIFVAFFVLALCAFADDSAFLTATSIPSPTQEEIKKALGSPKDRFGIPQDVYGINLALKAYKSMVEESEVSSAIVFWGGLVLMPLGYMVNVLEPDLVWAPYGIATGIPYGYFVMGAGGVFVIVDLVSVGPEIEKLKKKMASFFAESY
jgi:hypothetical protein